MSGTAGYSLDQLLEWCKQDHLIDGFLKEEGAILIWQGGTEYALNIDDARLYLTQMFTGVSRNSDDNASDARHTA